MKKRVFGISVRILAAMTAAFLLITACGGGTASADAAAADPGTVLEALPGSETDQGTDQKTDQGTDQKANQGTDQKADQKTDQGTDQNANPETALEAVSEIDPGTGDKDTAAWGEALTVRVQELTALMTTEEKISQMIIPAVRSWDGQSVTDLEAVPELAQALRRHQYGGIILFGGNVVDNAQTAKLVRDLQANNADMDGVSIQIPYFMPLDEEGGIVIRLNSGTRMTGSMAVGATGDRAEENALTTGRVLGEELAALGFNVDFAPDVDVNNNPANPVIGTRSFSDDPQTVAKLGQAFSQGLSEQWIIATYKHFPGHGDTSVDSHIGTPSVEKTYEELKQTELVPFSAAVRNGAEMIMTAHITFPLIDEEVTFGDGQTKGFYPATMSKKMITEILRGDMGYDGIVVTDALQMDAVESAGLVPGEEGSAEYHVNIAEKVINAGADILLIPRDLDSMEAVDFFDTYIGDLAAMVEDGTIPQARIDESVTRILRLKLKYGILRDDLLSGIEEIPGLPEIGSGEEDSSDGASGTASGDEGNQGSGAYVTVGSEEHHAAELEIARQAVTVVKNDAQTLPASGKGTRIVLLGRVQEDVPALSYYVRSLKEQGILDQEAQVTIDYYYDFAGEEGVLRYSDEMRDAIRSADLVIGTTRTYSLDALTTGGSQYEGIRRAIEDTHAGGGRFVLLSENLPYDAARFQDADAIVLAYMGSGMVDPTAGRENSNAPAAGNANVYAALETILGGSTPSGTLPVDIPVIIEREDGSLEYGTDPLYRRGFGLSW